MMASGASAADRGGNCQFDLGPYHPPTVAAEPQLETHNPVRCGFVDNRDDGARLGTANAALLSVDSRSHEVTFHLKSQPTRVCLGTGNALTDPVSALC